MAGAQATASQLANMHWLDVSCQTTDRTSAPSGLPDRRFGLPFSIMGPSSALADDEELFRLLMTDFDALAFGRPPCLLPVEGLGAPSVVAAGPLSGFFGAACVALAAVGDASDTLVAASLPCSALCLLVLGLVRPLRAMAAPELIGVDMDKADFLSDCDLLRLGSD
jgi:hypothetical protein